MWMCPDFGLSGGFMSGFSSPLTGNVLVLRVLVLNVP